MTATVFCLSLNPNNSDTVECMDFVGIVEYIGAFDSVDRYFDEERFPLFCCSPCMVL
jgi:hypothetical protein